MDEGISTNKNLAGGNELMLQRENKNLKDLNRELERDLSE